MTCTTRSSNGRGNIDDGVEVVKEDEGSEEMMATAAEEMEQAAEDEEDEEDEPQPWCTS
jgi:hypothetical protein